VRKPDHLASIVIDGIRFWTGIALIPAYLFINSPLIKLLLILFFSLSVSLAGKKIRYLYFIMMTASITFFHLLTPNGKILWDLGIVQVTKGSLLTGFTKGISLAGLVFISLFSVTPSLKLPGKLGGLLGRMFYYFEIILDGKKRVQAKDFIGSLDRILNQIFPLHRIEAVPEAVSGIRVKSRGNRAGNVLYPLIWAILMGGAYLLDSL